MKNFVTVKYAVFLAEEVDVNLGEMSGLSDLKKEIGEGTDTKTVEEHQITLCYRVKKREYVNSSNQSIQEYYDQKAISDSLKLFGDRREELVVKRINTTKSSKRVN